MTAPATMQCVACIGDRTVEVREVPVVEAGPGEVRLRIMASAVCGSDLHQYRDDAAERARHGWPEFAIGHEGAGVVESVGPGVDWPRIGDRIIIHHTPGCGVCEHCLIGEPNFCDQRVTFSRVRHGTNVEYLVAPANSALELPDDLDFEDGALLACNVGTAYGAVRKAGASGDITLAVFGQGPVGQYCVLMAKAMGATVAAVDVASARRELALKAGADVVLDGGADDIVEQVAAFGDGKGVHASIDTSGVVAARSNAVDALRVHGTYVEVGVGNDPTLKPRDFMFWKEVTLTGSWIFKRHEWHSLVDFVRRKRVPIKDIVTHRFRPDEAAEAFAVADSAVAGKVVFDWS